MRNTTAPAKVRRVSPCGASSPVDGRADMCTLPLHFDGQHVGTLHSWDDSAFDGFDLDELLWEEHRPAGDWRPPTGLATSDVLVAPPSARNVTPR